jgi:hypothetical protein
LSEEAVCAHEEQIGRYRMKAWRMRGSEATSQLQTSSSSFLDVVLIDRNVVYGWLVVTLHKGGGRDQPFIVHATSMLIIILIMESY